MTERVRTSLYLLESDSVNSLPSVSQHFERLLATSAVFSSKMEKKLIEFVRKREELHYMSHKKYSDSVTKEKCLGTKRWKG